MKRILSVVILIVSISFNNFTTCQNDLYPSDKRRGNVEEQHHPHHDATLSDSILSKNDGPHLLEANSRNVINKLREGDRTPTNSNDGERPNIILIMTDDQDVELGSMEYMPETLKYFRDEGIEFRHGYVSTPMCCPSRSSILTGLYVHNHDVFTNNDNCSSIQWRQRYEKKTFGSYLWNSGYYTSYIGKYLNKYDGSHIPFGWDEWNGLLMNSKFYNYTVNVNGRKQRHGNDYSRDYFPDLIANSTMDFLSRMSTDRGRHPFLLVCSFPSPHGPEDSAPQYSQMFLNATPHHTPNYNYAPNLDKQWILRQTKPMNPTLKDFTNLLMTKRLQTLQSVDAAVKGIMDKLKSSGLDETTYVFYTSDHGYHVGQFGLVKGKSMPYEFDIRVPFYLHGPSSRVSKGIQILEPVMNIDLAPTFLDLAGIPVPEEMDGISLIPLVRKYSPDTEELSSSFVWRDVFLIESSGRREIPETDSETEGKPKKNRKGKEEDKLQLLKENIGTAGLGTLCQLYPHPCLPGQKKYCRKYKDQEDRVQFHKCRALDFVDDYLQYNDPLHEISSTNTNHNMSIEPHLSLTGRRRCRCRFRRSLDNDDDETLDWEMERQKIDGEIETLKRKIEELRTRRRTLRRKWLVQTNNTDIENHNHHRNRKGKAHDIKEDEERSFSTHDFDLSEIEATTPTTSFTTELLKSTSTTSSRRNKHYDEEDSEEDEEDEEEEDDEEDDEDDEEDEDESSEEEEDEIIEEKVPTSTSTTTSTTTTTTTSTTTSTTSEPPMMKERKVHHRRRFKGGLNPIRKGLDFNGFQIDSFVRHKHNRHRERNRQQMMNGTEGRRHRYRTEDQTKPAKERLGGELGGSRKSEDVDGSEACECEIDPRWFKQRERDERKRKKLLSKIRKKQKYMKRIEDPDERRQAETCGSEEKMNCFWHDKDHWKTAPFWTGGSFCFCMNANNNTYSCVRSVNATHNYLYCQFVTGFKMYFDLRKDPYQLKNAIGTLPAEQEDWILTQLIRLKKCKGRRSCSADHKDGDQTIQSNIWEQIFGRWPRKKRRGQRRRHL